MSDALNDSVSQGAGWQKQRSRHQSKRQDVDKQPPHSEEGEAGVLGSILFDTVRAPGKLKETLERFGGDKVFFDLRNQTILDAMVELHNEGKAIDSWTVRARLNDKGQLEQVGGESRLYRLQDKVPGPENLPTYLAMVWEKYLARLQLQTAGHIQSAILEKNGLDEVTLARIKRLQEEFEQKSQRGNITHQYLKVPADFEEGFFGRFFGGHAGEAPGLELPIPFVLKIRMQETTLVSGDDGSGKSTLLAYFLLHLANQLPAGEKVIVASLEEPSWVTLWRLAAMLLGTKHLPDSDTGRGKASAALAWLNDRFVIYDFTGIADWRDLLLAFRFAAERMGVRIGLIDSAMRIGIPDDDYAQQGMAASAMAQFAKDFMAHLFCIIHENKGDGKGKTKVRGSKLWTANVDNVLRVELNHAKGEKVANLNMQLANERSQQEPNAAYMSGLEKDLAEVKRLWDTRLVLQKQRYPGTWQNGAKGFWFDPECFQFRANWQDTPVNWLDRWRKARPARNGGQE